MRRSRLCSNYLAQQGRGTCSDNHELQSAIGALACQAQPDQPPEQFMKTLIMPESLESDLRCNWQTLLFGPGSVRTALGAAEAANSIVAIECPSALFYSHFRVCRGYALVKSGRWSSSPSRSNGAVHTATIALAFITQVETLRQSTVLYHVTGRRYRATSQGPGFTHWWSLQAHAMSSY